MWTEWKGNKIIEMYEDEMQDAVHEAVESTGAYINDNTVPHDEGTLSSSRYIQDDPNEVATWIGYGGGGISGFPVVPYAMKWHETPANFQKGRSHNYLRAPMNIVYPERLKRAVARKGLRLI